MTADAAVEAEAIVLGAVMLDPRVLDTVGDVLRPEHFQAHLHARVFRAFATLVERVEPIDLVTVIHELRRAPEGLTPADQGAVAGMLDGVPRIADASHWVGLVREGWRRRKLAEIGGKIAEHAAREDETADDVIDRAQAALARLMLESEGRNVRRISTLLTESSREIDAFVASAAGITGVPSGFGKLDRLLGGFQRGALNVVAARPRRGKSVFCGQAARNAAGAGFKVLAFTLEMPPAQVVTRLVMAEGRIDRWDLKARPDEHLPRVAHAMTRLRDLPLWFDGRPSPSLAQIAATAKRQQATEGLDLLVIDYLQRCARDRKLDDWQAVGELVKGLKGLALSLDIPILCACQLNRQAEDAKPNLSQLRNSGDIEQEADVIGFLHPHTIPNVSAEKAMEMDYPPVDLWIEKHRNGPGAIVELTLERPFTRFAARDVREEGA